MVEAFALYFSYSPRGREGTVCTEFIIYNEKQVTSSYHSGNQYWKTGERYLFIWCIECFSYVLW